MARSCATGAAASRTTRPPGTCPTTFPNGTRSRVRERVPRYQLMPVGYTGPGKGPRVVTFRANLRYPKQRVTDKNVTTSRVLAWLWYRELCARKDLVGRAVAAVITANGRQLAFHAFDDPRTVDPWQDSRNQ